MAFGPRPCTRFDERPRMTRLPKSLLLSIISVAIACPISVQAQAPSPNRPAARVAAAPQTGPPKAPFPPLSPAVQADLQDKLRRWETQSRGTKTLELKFAQWHYDVGGAPAGTHTRRSDGVIKYAAPDKGLYRVDRMVFFVGMQNGKPQFKNQPGQFGQHWVCTGTQLIEFDRTNEECKIQDIPKEFQGTNISEGPLPFVFNADAAKIQKRYWVRPVQSPEPNTILIEAWPKLQKDRAQYKYILIALDDKTCLPKALVMYAPNFHPKTAPIWDHYEFSDVKRNSIGARMGVFLKYFIPKRPPANWKIYQDKAPVSPPPAAQNGQRRQPG